MPDERIDIDMLSEEIQQEAQRLRAEGRLAPETERELDAQLRPDVPPPLRKREVGRMRAALADAGFRAAVESDVPTASGHAGGALVKRGVKALVGWYVGTIANQVRDFSGATLRVLGAISDAVREVDHDLTRLQWRVEALEEELHTSSGQDPETDDRT
jgi:hypothetical protein